MKLLVCGDRNWNNEQKMYDAFACFINFDNNYEDITLIHGDATGADKMSERVLSKIIQQAKKEGMQVGNLIIDRHPARWWEVDGKPASQLGRRYDNTLYWKAAGPVRNREMLSLQPDLVIAFHSSIASSKGTKDMIFASNLVHIPVVLIG